MSQRPLRVISFPKEGGNPYLNQLSAHLEAAGLCVEEFSFPRAFRRSYDVLHIHWPDTHLWSRSWWRSLGKHLRLAALCGLLRLRGTRIVWTVHNLRAHEKNHWIGRWLFPWWFPRCCTDVIALSPTGLELAYLVYPPLRRKPAAIIAHGHYRDVFRRAVDREPSRAALGLDPRRFTLVFFGWIRRYKNVPHLIDVFRSLANHDVQLVVAGKPVVGMGVEEIEQAAGDDPRVHLHLRHVPDHEVPTFLGAADLVVTPYAEVLNSGSVLLALSMDRPVLAPRTGALPDLQRVVGPRWLRLYEGALNSTVLENACTAVRRMNPRETTNLSAFEWPEIAAATIELYTRPRRRGSPSSDPATRAPQVWARSTIARS